jgi:predicted ATPase
LTEADVVTYLAQRTAVGARRAVPLQDLAWVIHQRTDGNPLFMVNVVDDLLARGELESANVEINAPTTIRQMIEYHFERLNSEEQQLIETASATGIEFSAAAVATCNEAAIEEVERNCAALAWRGQFLNAVGVSEWPDGTAASRYTFQHALYQEVIYDRVTAAQKVTWHRRIAERLETAYGKRANEIAAELAVHFERGREYQRAIQYLQQAGQNAIRRSAHQEAITLLTKGLESLKTLPDTSERTQQELSLQITLGSALVVTKGFGAPEVEKTYARARELCREIGETPRLFPMLQGLRVFYLARGKLQMAYELAEQLLRLAQGRQDVRQLMGAHVILGETLFCLGELLLAQEHFKKGIALHDSQQPHHPWLWVDNKVISLAYGNSALWLLGYPDQALQRSYEALTVAEALSHPFSVAWSMYYVARAHQDRREIQPAQERAAALIAFSAKQGFPYWTAVGTVIQGWALAKQGQGEEGIALIRQGLAAFRATGTELSLPLFLALLSEACRKVRRLEEGLTVLAEAIAAVARGGVRFYEAELYRLKGELTLQLQVESHKSKIEEAQACFLKAINIAQRQHAKSLELRATVSLARLWQQQGKRKEARQMLAEIYSWFTEGFDTGDLKEAKALLEMLLV